MQSTEESHYIIVGIIVYAMEPNIFLDCVVIVADHILFAKSTN